MSEKIKPAASVALLRETEGGLQTLLLRRNPALVFAGDNWVFPGGKVESGDLQHADGDKDIANRTAAQRECHEETGIVIDESNLIPISHWTTPDIMPKRFATQFYICCTTANQQVTVDQSEIIDYAWLSAEQAIAQHQQGTLAILPPTLVTLSEMAKYCSFGELLTFYQHRGVRHYNPRVKKLGKGQACFLYQGDSGYLATNPDVREQLNRCELYNGVIEYICNID